MIETVAISGLLTVVLAQTVPARTPRPKPQPVEVTLDLLAGAPLGRYEGDRRVRLGKVTDRGAASDPGVLGTVRRGKRTRVTFSASPDRATSVRDALGAALGGMGIVAKKKTAGTLDVALHRQRLYATSDGVRAESFLEIVIGTDGSPPQRVLICGSAQLVGKRNATTGRKVHQAAFDAALEALVASQTFQKSFGRGWTSQSEQKPSDVKPAPVTGFARPPEAAQKSLPRVTAALEGLAGRPIVLVDFELADKRYAKRAYADEEWARRWLPDLVAGHLALFYPAAEIERRATAPPGAKGVVVTGLIDRLDPSGGNNKLDVTVNLRNGSTGAPLLTLDVDWTSRQSRRKRPAVELAADDAGSPLVWGSYSGTAALPPMGDALASGLGYLLGRSLGVEPIDPESLEIAETCDASQ